MKIIQNSHLGMALCAAFVVSGCVKPDMEDDGQAAAQDTPVQVTETAAPDVQPAQFASIDYASASTVQDLIESRSDEYEKLTVQARQQGMVGGALRGALIGLIIDTDPALIAGGAIVGGIIGSHSGQQVASKLILEHKNYLIRRWSLERVLASVKTDSKDTRFDLMLSDTLVKSAQKSQAAPVAKADLAKLTTFKTHAVSRALALREILPIYDENPVAKQALKTELDRQMAMISQFEQNLNTLETLT